MQQVIDDQVKQIQQQAKTIADYVEEIKKLEFFVQIERKNAISDIEDKYYEHWKEMNAKYMKRYIEELISIDKAVEVCRDVIKEICPNLIQNGEELKEMERLLRNKMEE